MSVTPSHRFRKPQRQTANQMNADGKNRNRELIAIMVAAGIAFACIGLLLLGF
jgi:hypothetical protein